MSKRDAFPDYFFGPDGWRSERRFTSKTGFGVMILVQYYKGHIAKVATLKL
jgi:hypothetical protein